MSKQELKEDTTMTEEREEFMVSPVGEETPKLRKSHFLKPTVNPKNQPIPKLPSFSLTSNPNINQLKRLVAFKGRPVPQMNWQKWVQSLQKTHQEKWKKVGIFDAIRASTYTIKRHSEVIIELAQKWCPETNTFVFSWGECTISLEDVMILGGFSVLGDSVLSPFQNREIEEIENKLISHFYEIKKKCNGLVTHGVWMGHFMGFGGDMEHVALLVLWLSRYVFSTDYCGYVSPCVFCIAISLARGTRIALAPAVLAVIYKELSMLKEKVVSFMCEGGNNCRELVLWAAFQFVQLWVWERFPSLGPEPICLLRGEPRLARWQNLTKPRNRSLKSEFESLGKSFIWRPYALTIENWELPEFYCDEERWMVISSESGDELLTFGRCLRACELVGLNCVEQYLPHRVGMQFGMDQDIPGSVPRSNGSLELAWSCYDAPLNGVKFYLTPQLLKGCVTVRYSHWWKKALRLCSPNSSAFKQLRRSPRNMKKPSLSLDGTRDDIEMLCFCSLCEVYDGKPSSPSFVESVTETHVETELPPSCDKSSHPSGGTTDGIDMQCPFTACNVHDAPPSSSSIVKTVTDMHNETEKCSSSENRNHPSESHAESCEGMPPKNPQDVVNGAVCEMNSAVEPPEECGLKDVNLSESFMNTHQSLNESLPVDGQAVSEVEPMLGMSSKSPQHAVDEIVEKINSAMGPLKECGVEKVKASSSSMTIGAVDKNFTDTHQSPNETLPGDISEVEEPMIGVEMKKLCALTIDDEPAKGSEDVKVTQANCSLDELVIIDDDDDDEGVENGDFNCFEALCSEFEARISKLERVVSGMQAAKLGSKAR